MWNKPSSKPNQTATTPDPPAPIEVAMINIRRIIGEKVRPYEMADIRTELYKLVIATRT